MLESCVSPVDLLCPRTSLVPPVYRVTSTPEFITVSEVKGDLQMLLNEQTRKTIIKKPNGKQFLFLRSKISSDAVGLGIPGQSHTLLPCVASHLFLKQKGSYINPFHDYLLC